MCSCVLFIFPDIATRLHPELPVSVPMSHMILKARRLRGHELPDSGNTLHIADTRRWFGEAMPTTTSTRIVHNVIISGMQPINVTPDYLQGTNKIIVGNKEEQEGTKLEKRGNKETGTQAGGRKKLESNETAPQMLYHVKKTGTMQISPPNQRRGQRPYWVLKAPTAC